MTVGSRRRLTAPPSEEPIPHPRKVQKVSFVRAEKGWKSVRGLIVFGSASGCNYSETSSQNREALVWFGQNM